MKKDRKIFLSIRWKNIDWDWYENNIKGKRECVGDINIFKENIKLEIMDSNMKWTWKL